MKPKEFIKKHNLEKGWQSKKQDSFLQDFTSELLAFLELNKAENNIRGFENSVKVIRMKWDAISNKIPYGLPEGLWSYFWATIVVKLRDELCPKEMERRRKIVEEKKAFWKKRREQERLLDEECRQAMFEHLAFLYLSMSAVPPYKSFQYLGLPDSATAEEVTKRYRELSVKCHPDNGGSQEKFIELTEHKNKALKWAKRYD